MSDIEEDTQLCPLCMEEMDLSDRNFLPCPCGYKVCMWCWHHIRENLNGLCPACRTPYNADPHAFSAVDRQEIVKKNRERKQKEKHEKKTDRPTPAPAGPVGATNGTKPTGSTTTATIDRRHLHNYRVVQRNLVYVIGVPATIATEDVLRKPEYFGQYGKIGKVVIHRNNTASHTSVSAYVTFVHKEDAKAAIQALDGYYLDNHMLRASFGTTKYCNNFIRAVPCNNPECVYLHELGDDDDRFTKEEIQAGHSKLAQVPGKDQSIVTGNGGPSGTGKKPTGEPVLPPPVFIQDNVTSTNSSQTTSTKPAPAARASTWSASGAEILGGMTSQAFISDSPQMSAASPPTGSLSSSDPPTFKSLPPIEDTTDFPTIASSTAALKRSIPSGSSKPSNAISAEAKGVPTIVEQSISSSALEKVPDQNIADVQPTEIDLPQSDPKPVSSTTTSSAPANIFVESKPLASVPLQPKLVAASSISAQSLLLGNTFNGLSKSAVFPVPVSSLSISVWSAILSSSTNGNGDLNVNPFGHLYLPLSELLDLTLPPVDAVCLSPWPKPQAYYRQGLQSENNNQQGSVQQLHRTSVDTSDKIESSLMNRVNQSNMVNNNNNNNNNMYNQNQISNNNTHNITLGNTAVANNANGIPGGINTLRQLFPVVNVGIAPNPELSSGNGLVGIVNAFSNVQCSRSASSIRMANDPLGSIELGGGKIYDPLNLLTIHNINPGVLPHAKWWQESEIKHCRIAMLASVGAFASQIGLTIPGYTAVADPVENLNKFFTEWPFGFAQIIFSIGLIEGASDPSEFWFGKGERAVGALGYDPLGFSKGKSQEVKDKYQLNELKNGRLAMIAMAAYTSEHWIPGSVPFIPGKF
eukprot:gene9263-12478_t